MVPICLPAQWPFPANQKPSGCFMFPDKRCPILNLSPSNWLSFPTAVFPPVLLPLVCSSRTETSRVIFHFSLSWTHPTRYSHQLLSLVASLLCSQDFLSTPITATLIWTLVTLLPAFARAFNLVSLDQAFLSRSLYIGNQKQSSCFNVMYLLLENFQWLSVFQRVTFKPLQLIVKDFYNRIFHCFLT